MGHFLAFYSTNQKIKILKKWKKLWRYYFTFVDHKWQSHDVWFLRYRVQQAKSFLILDHFLPFYWKIKVLKKKAWRYHQLTLVYHKYQSYDVWFLRYKVQWTEFFVDYFFSLLTSFDIFCPFTPLTTPKNQNFEKLKKAPHHFKQEYQKLWSYAIPFLRYGSWWIYFSFFILSCFLPFSSTWRYHQITHGYQKLWSNTILFLRYSGWQK